ncbi:MAG: ATP-binding protein [Bacteroidales bacterium]
MGRLSPSLVSTSECGTLPMSTLVLKTASDGPAGQLADSPISADSQSPGDLFEREDWTLFRSLTTLGQKAGVPSARLPRLVAKELADNALDASGSCRVELLDGNGFWVEDDGDGIPGDDQAVASLFSISCPLASSKILRRPSRGALGNGLRVVTGAILASAGTLHVSTRGRTLEHKRPALISRRAQNPLQLPCPSGKPA